MSTIMRRFRVVSGLWAVVFLSLFTLIAAGLPASVQAQSAPDAAGSLAAISAAGRASGRVLQVDLATHPKISQYAHIDSSPKGFGKNACGLVAAAAALGGNDWVALVADLANAAGSDYHPNLGIQPSRYVAALRTVLGQAKVTAVESLTLQELYSELAAGKIVIVDIKVNATRNLPSTKAPNYAHFARVLGLDLDRGEIYIENTLRGAPYWTVSLDEFLKAWERPETTSSLVPDPKNAEDVTRWAVFIDDAVL
jgi:hypothetical protein